MVVTEDVKQTAPVIIAMVTDKFMPVGTVRTFAGTCFNTVPDAALDVADTGLSSPLDTGAEQAVLYTPGIVYSVYSSKCPAYLRRFSRSPKKRIATREKAWEAWEKCTAQSGLNLLQASRKFSCACTRHGRWIHRPSTSGVKSAATR